MASQSDIPISAKVPHEHSREERRHITTLVDVKVATGLHITLKQLNGVFGAARICQNELVEAFVEDSQDHSELVVRERGLGAELQDVEDELENYHSTLVVPHGV